MSAGRLEGRRAVVTGHASGIGRATTARLVSEGVRVVGLDLAGPDGNRADGAGLAREIRADVGDESSLAAARDQALAELGGLDMLVHCAGVEVLGNVLEVSPDEWDRAFRVNVRGTYLVARSFLAALLDGGGVLVNLGSDAGLTGDVGLDAYTATKHAVVGLTKCLAVTWGSQGLRANVVCPGLTMTPMAERIIDAADEAERDRYHRFVPSGRLGRPEEIAATIAFLLSDDATYINGAVISVDGGATAGYFHHDG